MTEAERQLRVCLDEQADAPRPPVDAPATRSHLRRAGDRRPEANPPRLAGRPAAKVNPKIRFKEGSGSQRQSAEDRRTSAAPSMQLATIRSNERSTPGSTPILSLAASPSPNRRYAPFPSVYGTEDCHVGDGRASEVRTLTVAAARRFFKVDQGASGRKSDLSAGMGPPSRHTGT